MSFNAVGGQVSLEKQGFPVGGSSTHPLPIDTLSSHSPLLYAVPPALIRRQPRV